MTTNTQHPGRLIYLMGASGSGKDSLLAWLGQALRSDDRILIAHRYVTRRSTASEASVTLSSTEFARRVALNTFALQWRSHGLAYGIGLEINAWLAAGMVVLVNGSREYLPRACQLYPCIEAVEVFVPPEILRARLQQRGRENDDAINERLARATQRFSAPAECRLIRISNDGPLEVAGAALLALTRASTPGG
ncbi:MAG: phosphonate metabolism protein/1,5-bisphosphokinase (PRPP-forming) PhnN [Janthinobacterium lividum]